MGTFDDDVAQDVHDVWDAAIERGVAEATRAIREQVKFEGDTFEGDKPVVFFALASLQLDAGHLDDPVKDFVLASLASDIGRWEESALPEDVTERRRVLEALRQRIERFANTS